MPPELSPSPPTSPPDTQSPVAPPPEGEESWTYEIAHPDSDQDLAPIVGRNLRKLRVQRGLSLERLSKASGVSRAMLGQTEVRPCAFLRANGGLDQHGGGPAGLDGWPSVSTDSAIAYWMS